MEALPRPREPVPAVVPEVHGERLGEEQSRVEPHRGREDPAHERPEPRVERDQEEEQQAAQEGRRREGRERELDELVGEPVVAPTLLAVHPDPPADELDDDGEDRHAQDERGEVQVDLGDHPDREPRADHGKRPVRRPPSAPGPSPGVARNATAAATRRTGSDARKPGRPGVRGRMVSRTVVVPRLLRDPGTASGTGGRPGPLVPIVTRTSTLCRAARGPLSRASSRARDGARGVGVPSDAHLASEAGPHATLRGGVGAPRARRSRRGRRARAADESADDRRAWRPGVTPSPARTFARPPAIRTLGRGRVATSTSPPRADPRARPPSRSPAHAVARPPPRLPDPAPLCYRKLPSLVS